MGSETKETANMHRQEEEASRLTQGGEEGGGKDVEIVLVHYNAYLLTCWA